MFVDLESEMGQIGTDHDRTALIELTDLDFLLASGRFEKNELRAPAGGMAPGFFEPENIPVKRYGFFQVGDAVAGVQKLFDHCFV